VTWTDALIFVAGLTLPVFLFLIYRNRQTPQKVEEVHEVESGSLMVEALTGIRQISEAIREIDRAFTVGTRRGQMGEVQLQSILEDILTPDQYGKRVETVPGSGKVVEFAVKMPGRSDQNQVWLPIDAKFPLEDHRRVQTAFDKADAKALKNALEGLEKAILKSAKDIHEKYIRSPHTTNFGVLYLPSEGLYANVLGLSGIHAKLRDLGIVIAGPPTMSALLNAWRMGFQTLALEERASEVWKLLSSVSAEYDQFEGVVNDIEKQLGTVQTSVGGAGTRIRAMRRALKALEELPTDDA
jgi:DNA recombination protein RmuC